MKSHQETLEKAEQAWKAVRLMPHRKSDIRTRCANPAMLPPPGFGSSPSLMLMAQCLRTLCHSRWLVCGCGGGTVTAWDQLLRNLGTRQRRLHAYSLTKIHLPCA